MEFTDIVGDPINRTAFPQLPLIGPGEIIGFDARAVIRTFPVANESDAEYLHFAYAEFRDPDLPWRYTPAAASQDRLRPWLMLVLFTDDEGSTAPVSASNPLPVASIDRAALPPKPMQAWAWAHAQFNGTTADAALATGAAPGLGLSRIYCPRTLVKRQRYNAVLVPYFERGRQAGLGVTFPDSSVVDPATNPDILQAAWNEGETTGRLDFPVYYQWSFSTGETGSFEQLARRLAPNPLPPNLGLRGMDVSAPGLNLPPVASAANLANDGIEGGMGAEGALWGLDTAPTNWEPADKNAWAAALKPIVEKGEEVMAATGVRRLLVPAMYGRWHAARSNLNDNNNRPWFNELNIDPRYRVAAALGTEVVQRNQEELMTSAWRQLGQLREVNAHLKVLQAAREASKRLWKRNFLSRSDNLFLRLTSLLHSRVRAAGDLKTIYGFVRQSPLAGGVISTNWRRFTRPFGSVGRKQGRPFFASDAVPDIIDPVNDGTLAPGNPPPAPADLATLSTAMDGTRPASVDDARHAELAAQTEQRLVFWGLLLIYASRELLIRRQGNYWWLLVRGLRLGTYFIRMAINANAFGVRNSDSGFPTGADITNQPSMGNFTPVAEGALIPPSSPPSPIGTDSVDAQKMRRAMQALFDVLGQPPAPAQVLVKLKIGDAVGKLKAGLSPETTIAKAFARRLATNGITRDPGDELEPIMAAPEFPQPMLETLQEISNEWVLPGIGQLQPDTLGLVEPNQKFIEAFMVGLNHEMARELLFREYPTDQRGTYFRNFWDDRGFVATAAAPALTGDDGQDINYIHAWRNAPLGANSPRRNVFSAGRRHIVLIVRGELIRRYPNVIVSAVKSNSDKTGFAKESDGTLKQKHPVFFGRLPPDTAIYGFELREQEDLKTAHGWFFVLQEQPAEPKFGLNTNPESAPPFFDAEPPGTISTSADIATALFRSPFRVAVHSLSLFAPGS